jgi:hypothetical protein
MRLSKATRLKPGNVIIFGDHVNTVSCSQWWRGIVLQVTPNGTITVRVIESKLDRHPSKEVRQIPHTYVL